MPDSFFGGGNYNSGYGSSKSTGYNGSGGGGTIFGGGGSQGGTNAGTGTGAGNGTGSKPNGGGGVNAAAAAAAAMAVANAAQRAQQQKQQQQGQQNRSPLDRRVISSQGFGNLPDASMRPGPGFNGGLGLQAFGQGHLPAAGANLIARSTQLQGLGSKPSLPGAIPNQNMKHETTMNGGFGMPGYGLRNNASLPTRAPQTQIAATPRFTGIGGGVGVQAYGQSVRPAADATRTSLATQVRGSPQVAMGKPTPAAYSPMAGQGQPGFNQHSKINGLDPAELRREFDGFASANYGLPGAAPDPNIASGPETMPDPPDSWLGSLGAKVGNGLEAAKLAAGQIAKLPGNPDQQAALIKNAAGGGGLLGKALAPVQYAGDMANDWVKGNLKAPEGVKNAALGAGQAIGSVIPGYTGGAPTFAPSTGLQVYPGSTGQALSGAGGQSPGGGGGGGGMSGPSTFSGGGLLGGGIRRKKKKKDDDAGSGGGTNTGGPKYPAYYSTWAGLPTGPVLG